MEIIDISMPINENMMVYKNDQQKKPKIEITRDFVNGEGARESRISLELHTGTHMDAPLHMIEGGRDSEIFKVSNMVCPCKVIDLSNVEDYISKTDLEDKNIEKDDFIILKTKNSNDECFNSQFIYLAEDGAKYLSDVGIRGVGIDSLGIERSQSDHKTHKVLLENDIIILEGLRLKHVEEGRYTLIAAPLNIQNVEAVPVRALLVNTIT